MTELACSDHKLVVVWCMQVVWGGISYFGNTFYVLDTVSHVPPR